MKVASPSRPLRASALLLALASTAPLSAQEPRTLSYGEPEDVGMSSSVLDAAIDLYRDAVERGDLVGAVILVARKGVIVRHEAIGMRDKERGLPMERNTLFRMASNTKAVVVAGLLQQIEGGNLDYDDLVREHIPAWDNYRSGFITIGQLLEHSSGLRISTLFLEPLGDNPTLQSETARFGALGAEAVPGRTYSYNDAGYNALGALLEIASGRLLEEQLMRTIYEPLSMADSYNHRAGHTVDGKLDRMGPAYYRRGPDGDWIPEGTPGGPIAYPFARASGGMISTAWDFAVFAQMLLNGGVYDGERILSSESVDRMTSPYMHIRGEGDSAWYSGYGWWIVNGTYGHAGSDGTNAWVDPARETIVLVFTQTPDGANPIRRFSDWVNRSIFDR